MWKHLHVKKKQKDNKKMKKTVILIVTAIIALSSSMAWGANKTKKDPTKGYRLTLAVIGNNDTVMYLGNYYAGRTYAFDTAYRTKKGLFVFEKKERQLLPGLYFFTSPSGNYVEFAVYNNEKLDIYFETSEPGWQSNMKVKGSKENEILFGYHQANRQIIKKSDEARRTIKDSAELDKTLRAYTIEMDSIKMEYVTKYPNSLLSLLMNATREPEVPTEDSLGNKLSNRQRYEYYMDHYFDYSRLDDDALIRTPEMVFKRRLDNYLDRNLKDAPPEMIIEYVDKLIEKARPSKENFKYLVHTIAEKYLQSNIISYDAIYVHMVKKYIETGECEWMSPTTVDENVKRANTWERLLIGKPAPPLIMKDDKGQWQSMYSLPNKYTLLVFWSPTCGHCKLMIPDLYKRFEKYRDRCDIAAYAILSEPDDNTRPLWHKFIEEHKLDWINLDGGEANLDWHEVYDIITTPQIYLLDKDKKILAKKLSGETFEEVIKMLEKIE